MRVREDQLNVIKEQIVDFNAFKVNGFPMEGYFETQGLMPFFDMLNGLCYMNLVKDFWVRAEVFNEIDAQRKVNAKIAEDKSNNVKTIAKIVLKVFTETEV